MSISISVSYAKTGLVNSTKQRIRYFIISSTYNEKLSGGRQTETRSVSREKPQKLKGAENGTA